MADEQKVVLVEIDININSAIEAQKKLAETIVDLKAKTANLADTEGKLSEAYLKSSAELKAAQQLRTKELAEQTILTKNKPTQEEREQRLLSTLTFNKSWIFEGSSALESYRAMSANSSFKVAAASRAMPKGLNEINLMTPKHTP